MQDADDTFKISLETFFGESFTYIPRFKKNVKECEPKKISSKKKYKIHMFMWTVSEYVWVLRRRKKKKTLFMYLLLTQILICEMKLV